MADNNGAMTDREARVLAGAGKSTPPPAIDDQSLDTTASEGTMARGSYRRSRYIRLWNRAVVNDDGTPITALTEERLARILSETETIHELLSKPASPAIDLRSDSFGAIYTTSKVYRTLRQTVPGIGAAVLYTSGDAFGTKMIFPVPVEGTISNIHFIDHDDEGLAKELVLFDRDFTETADNAAFAPSDDDMRNCIGVISITNFYNFSLNQMGEGTPALGYIAPEGKLWGQWVTRGGDTIAAGASPDVWLVIV